MIPQGSGASVRWAQHKGRAGALQALPRPSIWTPPAPKIGAQIEENSMESGCYTTPSGSQGVCVGRGAFQAHLRLEFSPICGCGRGPFLVAKRVVFGGVEARKCAKTPRIPKIPPPTVCTLPSNPPTSDPAILSNRTPFLVKTVPPPSPLSDLPCAQVYSCGKIEGGATGTAYRRSDGNYAGIETGFERTAKRGNPALRRQL